MENIWLIQRAKFKTEIENPQNIDSILYLDYMGSAEFEWGALPKSLKRIRENVQDYVYLDYFFGEKCVTLFAHKNAQSMRDVLEKLSKGEYRLKEFCDLKDWINPSLHPYQKNDFWWDIENDFMFWKKNVPFEIQFKKVIGGKV